MATRLFLAHRAARSPGCWPECYYHCGYGPGWDDEKTYTVTVTRAAPSSNADLSNLVLSAGSPLTPPFASGTTSYTLNVPFSIDQPTATPTAADANATITVNGTTQ